MKRLDKRRRREHKTNYLKRKRLLESGKPRVVIRKSNRYILLQYVESKIAQDSIKYSLSSKELLKYGWPKEKIGSLKCLGASYLTGLLFGKIIAKEKEKEIILDTGLIKSTAGSRIYSAVKGIADAGIDIKHNKKVFPKEERINSEKIKDFFDKVKNKIIKGEKQDEKNKR